MDLAFDSLNPYQALQTVSSTSPDELCEKLRSIKRPIKIIQIVASNNQYTAFFTGDVKILKKGKT